MRIPASTSPKRQVIELLREMPDDASIEDILYELHVWEKLVVAEQDSREGRIHTHEEMKERLKQWLTP